MPNTYCRRRQSSVMRCPQSCCRLLPTSRKERSTQPGTASGDRVPLRNTPLSRARVYLQARPHSRSSLQRFSSTSAAVCCTPALWMPWRNYMWIAWLNRSTGCAPRLAGRGVGQGKPLLSTGRSQGDRTLSPPGGGQRPLRGPGSSPASPRPSRQHVSKTLISRFDLRNVLQPLGEDGRILVHLRQAKPLVEALGDTRRLVYLASLHGHVSEAIG